MPVLSKTSLMCGTDIPLLGSGLVLHQPTIKEIAMIGGEETFYKACELLLFTKDKLLIEDKQSLDDFSDFDIIMTMMNGTDPQSISYKVMVLQLLTLLFPRYSPNIVRDHLEFTDSEDENNIRVINNSSFPELREVIVKIFLLEDTASNQYDPAGPLAQKLAKKFAERKKKLMAQQQNQKEEEFDVFGRYMSVLQVAFHVDLFTLSNYTVYQLFDSFHRYQLWTTFDTGIKIQLQGGKVDDLGEEWSNWMRVIG